MVEVRLRVIVRLHVAMVVTGPAVGDRRRQRQRPVFYGNEIGHP